MRDLTPHTRSPAPVLGLRSTEERAVIVPDAVHTIDAMLLHLLPALDQRPGPEVEASLRRRIDVLLDERLAATR